MSAGTRRPRRWAEQSGGGSNAPFSSRRVSPAASPANNAPLKQKQGRWGSNLSTQRRERTVVWASCLQKVQVLRQGGSWQRAEGDTFASSAPSSGMGASPSEQDDENTERLLGDQLDILATLSYPNSSISPQDAGFMVTALCEAVPQHCSDGLAVRVSQFFITLCAKQQKVAFLTWQLNIVLDFLVRYLARVAITPPSAAAASSSSPPSPPPSPSHLGRCACARALAQLLYENGDRLGTRFDDVLPQLLDLATPSAVDLETKHAALDALANLSLKNWAGFTEPQRQAACSCLTQNFVKHWRAFYFASSPPSSSPSSHPARTASPHAAAAAAGATSPSANGWGGAAECKVLASATRGLACAVGKSGVVPVLEPYLARVVHALNHLVQPAVEGERVVAAAQAGRGGSGSTGAGSSRSASGSRGRSRSSRGFGWYVGGGGGGGSGVSPTRSSASASLADPKARVRLQALALLEAMATKDAKSLYPHWAMFFAPWVPGLVNGGGSTAVRSSGAAPEGSGDDPVLPAGLLSILESDDAPQVRAAAAGAATSLVKNAPLRKWMPLLQQASPSPLGSSGTSAASAGIGVTGIGERVGSMMLRLHRSLADCLAREQSPAVVAKLCACAGALVAEMPYSVAVTGGGSSSSNGGSSKVHNARRTTGVEESLGGLLRVLTGLMTDAAGEHGARIAASQAMISAFSTKEPIAAIDSFLLDFRCAASGVASSSAAGEWGGGPAFAAHAAARGSSGGSSFGAELKGWSPLPIRPGSADDRGNRFVAGGTRSRGGTAESQQQRRRQLLLLRPSSSPLGYREGVSSVRGTGAWDDGGCAEDAAAGWGDGEGEDGGGAVLNSDGMGRSLDMPPPLPRVAADESTVVAAAASAVSSGGIGGSGGGGSSGGESFVDSLMALAGSPGQLRVEALCLLTRIGRSYPAHLSGGGGGGGGASGVQTRAWERVSALLLRCFADPDQNLRLHALKVLEALLLARAEQAAVETAKPIAAAAAAAAAAAERAAEFSAAPAAENVSPQERPPSGGGGGDGDGKGGEVWRVLVQKHLQRALEDPYHGVRAVACSCHASLLRSDWEAFSDPERDRCLDRVLAATRDRAAGVNILAGRVIANIMTMAGQDGAAAWCRKPEFLERCAERLQEMMEDSKATIRAQAMLAVGNLSCSLHGIRSRMHPATACSSPGAVDSGSVFWAIPKADGNGAPIALTAPVQQAAGRLDDTAHFRSSEDLVRRPRLRSLCEVALRLTATESDQAAGSAVRALGYLASGLDPERSGGGGDGDGQVGDVEEDTDETLPTSSFSSSTLPSISGGGRGEDGTTAAVEGVTSAAGEPAAAARVATAGWAEAGQRIYDHNGDSGDEREEEDGSGDEKDKSLQDRSVLALSARLALEKEGAPEGEGGGGEALGGAVDRRGELAAAKCRWNCCIALGVVLSSRGVQARAAEASWAPTLMRSLRWAVAEDKNLKVRTHAALALRAIRDVRRVYGEQLPPILAGSLSGLRGCKQRSIAPDLTQLRYVSELKAALRSLVLHILVELVLGGESTAASIPAGGDHGDDCGAASTATLLEEYADELLDVLSSPESDRTLNASELLPYYRHHHERHLQAEAFRVAATATAGGGGGRAGGVLKDDGGTLEGLDADSSVSGQQQQQPLLGSLTPIISELVLAATVEGLVRMFASGVGVGIDVGVGTRPGEQPLLVSKQFWTACVAEAGRRRRRVAGLLFHGSHPEARADGGDRGSHSEVGTDGPRDRGSVAAVTSGSREVADAAAGTATAGGGERGGVKGTKETDGDGEM